jgi:hypothetical protein
MIREAYKHSDNKAGDENRHEDYTCSVSFVRVCNEHSHTEFGTD